MPKRQFLQKVAELYAIGNMADTEYKAQWTRPEMAGEACCQHLDAMLGAMVKCGALTRDEMQSVYDGEFDC